MIVMLAEGESESAWNLSGILGLLEIGFPELQRPVVRQDVSFDYGNFTLQWHQRLSSLDLVVVDERGGRVTRASAQSWPEFVGVQIRCLSFFHAFMLMLTFMFLVVGCVSSFTSRVPAVVF